MHMVVEQRLSLNDRTIPDERALGQTVGYVIILRPHHPLLEGGLNVVQPCGTPLNCGVKLRPAARYSK